MSDIAFTSARAKRAYDAMPFLYAHQNVEQVMLGVKDALYEPDGPAAVHLTNAVFGAINKVYGADPAGASDALERLLFEDEHDGSHLKTQLEGLFIDLLCRRPDMWPDMGAKAVRFGCDRFVKPHPDLDDRLMDFAMARDTPHRFLASGAVNFLRGDLDRAYPLFQQAARGPLQRMYLGAKSVGLDAVNDARLTADARDFTIHHKHDRKVTVLVAADMKYYRTFIHDLYRSVNDAGLGLHVHITNPTPSHGGYLNLPGVGYSSETFGVGKPDMAYLASLRFMRARQIQEAYGTPILIGDMDSVYKLPTPTLERLLKANDCTVSVAAWGASHVPWRTVVGAGLLISDRPEGAAFLQRLETYILSKLRLGSYPESWWFDQQALFDVAVASGPLNAFPTSPFTVNRKRPDVKKIAKRG